MTACSMQQGVNETTQNKASQKNKKERTETLLTLKPLILPYLSWAWGYTWFYRRVLYFYWTKMWMITDLIILLDSRNNSRSGEPMSHSTRFIALAEVGNAEKRKWLYALNIAPLEQMKESELSQGTTDETPSPYEGALEQRTPSSKKVPNQWRRWGGDRGQGFTSLLRQPSSDNRPSDSMTALNKSQYFRRFKVFQKLQSPCLWLQCLLKGASPPLTHYRPAMPFGNRKKNKNKKKEDLFS